MSVGKRENENSAEPWSGVRRSGSNGRTAILPTVPLLFSYGSLQKLAVQLTTFGRHLDGTPDELPGYERSLVRIEDAEDAALLGATHYENAAFNGRNDSRVHGMAYEVTEAELAAADVYEEPASYVRTAVLLASGRRAWVYVHVARGRSEVEDR